MKVISLFCGAGGMDLGFIQAGHKIVWANDYWEDATKTYKKNIGNHVICEDIRKIDLGLVPDADIVIGGFPCQGFSIANMNRNADDERNALYQFFIKMLINKQPSFFVAENVKGILNLEGGKVFNRILSDFSDVGYNCKYTLLNAVNYGVPQSRQRVFILGVRSGENYDISFPPEPTHMQSEFGKIKKFISVGEALKGLPKPEDKHDLKNHIYSKFKVKFNGYISNRKLNPAKPSPTVTARGDNKGGAMIMPHPFQHRRMSCREVAIIQGFPMDFQFEGAMTSVYTQIGNAVPPPLARAVASIFNNLCKLNRNKAIGSKSEQLVFQ